MPVHLYGVLDAEAVPTQSMRGLDGQTVRVLSLGARCAWVSDVAEPALEVTPQRLREHDAVLRVAVATEYSVVPTLLGRVYASDALLGAALERSADAIDAAMAMVRGRVEMSFLVAASGAVPVEEADELLEGRGAGRAHLRRIQNQVHAERILRERATKLALSATHRLSRWVVAERVVENPAPPVLAARAHLVLRENVARYVRTVDLEVASADPALRVVVRGPGAAYSFAAVQIG